MISTIECPDCAGRGWVAVVLTPVDPTLPANDAACDVECATCKGKGRVVEPCSGVHGDQPGRRCTSYAGHYGACHDRYGLFPMGRMIGT